RLVYRGMEPSTRNGELTETPMAVGGAAEAAQSRACKKGPGGRFRIQPPLQQALRKTEPPDSWQNQTMVFPQPIRHERCGWNILRPPTVPRRRQPEQEVGCSAIFRASSHNFFTSRRIVGSGMRDGRLDG